MVALDLTCKRVWSSPQYDVTTADLHATASDLVFTGGNEGYYALDGKSGTPLWKAISGSAIMLAVVLNARGERQQGRIILRKVEAA